MEIFVSSSGGRSKSLASALRELLPTVLHYVKPSLSERDLGAGHRWAQEIARELEAANFGVIYVTLASIDSQWILFESEVLAKSMNDAKVIPLLFGLEYSDVSGPLAQVQAKKFEKSELGEVVQAMNNGADKSVPAYRSSQIFEALSPRFAEQIQAVGAQKLSEKHARLQHEILEELVTSFRRIDSPFGELNDNAAETGPRPRRRYRRFHPIMFKELAERLSIQPDDPVVLLVWAWLLREKMPWISEAIFDTYRQARSSSDFSIRTASLKRLNHVMRAMSGKMAYELMGGRSRTCPCSPKSCQ